MAETAFPSTHRLLPLHYPVELPAIIIQPFGFNDIGDMDYYASAGFPLGHEGIDFKAKRGAPIYAAQSGTVLLIFRDNKTHPYGNHIRLQHLFNGRVYETVYAHLSTFDNALKLNSAVSIGTLLGGAGSTGHASAAHLHFSVILRGATANHETNWPKDVIDPTPLFVHL